MYILDYDIFCVFFFTVTSKNLCFVLFDLDFKICLKKVSKIIQSYSEYVTIQGIVYIFSFNQTTFGRWFWILAVCSMLGLGTYWSNQMYLGWMNQQVEKNGVFIFPILCFDTK